MQKVCQFLGFYSLYFAVANVLKGVIKILLMIRTSLYSCGLFNIFFDNSSVSQ